MTNRTVVAERRASYRRVGRWKRPAGHVDLAGGPGVEQFVFLGTALAPVREDLGLPVRRPHLRLARWRWSVRLELRELALPAVIREHRGGSEPVRLVQQDQLRSGQECWLQTMTARKERRGQRA